MDEIIALFNKHNIRYLAIGGQAVRLTGMPRYTIDWDIYIPPRDEENIAKINAVLDEHLDMPVIPLGPKGQHFMQVYQTFMGILEFHLAGVGLPRFEEAEARAVIYETEHGTPVKCLSLEDLLHSKKVADRPKDQDDIKFLEIKLATLQAENE